LVDVKDNHKQKLGDITLLLTNSNQRLGKFEQSCEFEDILQIYNQQMADVEAENNKLGQCLRKVTHSFKADANSIKI